MWGGSGLEQEIGVWGLQLGVRTLGWGRGWRVCDVGGSSGLGLRGSSAGGGSGWDRSLGCRTAFWVRAPGSAYLRQLPGSSDMSLHLLGIGAARRLCRLPHPQALPLQPFPGWGQNHTNRFQESGGASLSPATPPTGPLMVLTGAARIPFWGGVLVKNWTPGNPILSMYPGDQVWLHSGICYAGSHTTMAKLLFLAH